MSLESTDAVKLTANQWIDQLSKKPRQLGASHLRNALNRQRGECTWCGGQVKKPRVFWCSSACITEFNMRCSPAVIGSEVDRRDKGICAICGTDTKETKKAWRELYRALESLHLLDMPHRRYWDYRKCPCGLCGTLREHRDLTTTEADHIIPVVEGGGLCGLDGYRSLCVRCHKAETAKLAARMKQKRKSKSAN